jgi:hypothetical protein
MLSDILRIHLLDAPTFLRQQDVKSKFCLGEAPKQDCVTLMIAGGAIC